MATTVLKLLGADIGLSLVMLVDGEGAALANKRVQEEEIKACWSVSKSFFLLANHSISTKLYFRVSHVI